MTDPGLTNRLRQRSRRAGLAVGLSMALTIAVCIGSFAWIYAKADPFLSDFVGAGATSTGNNRPTATAEESSSEPAGSASEEPTPTAEEARPDPTKEPTPTPTPAEFRATHISNPNLRVNLRPQPTTDGDPVAILEAGTQLQFLGEQREESDGTWYLFKTEDGLEGWLREGTFQEL
jgi:cytoskeletal protein RodZ